MQVLFEISPLILFFAAYVKDIYFALIVLMVAILQSTWIMSSFGKIEGAPDRKRDV